MSQKRFIFAIHNRVLWISSQIFHIPVLDELYSVHLMERDPMIKQNEFTQFTVRNPNQFLQEELVHNPIQDQKELEAAILNSQKIHHFVRLSEYVNYAYLASVPFVFQEESDKIDVLAPAILKETLSPAPMEKHSQFVQQLLQEKKMVLKSRYIQFVHQIKNASQLDELNEIGYKIVFSAINVL